MLHPLHHARCEEIKMPACAALLAAVPACQRPELGGGTSVHGAPFTVMEVGVRLGDALTRLAPKVAVCPPACSCCHGWFRMPDATPPTTPQSSTLQCP